MFPFRSSWISESCFNQSHFKYVNFEASFEVLPRPLKNDQSKLPLSAAAWHSTTGGSCFWSPTRMNCCFTFLSPEASVKSHWGEAGLSLPTFGFVCRAYRVIGISNTNIAGRNVPSGSSMLWTPSAVRRQQAIWASRQWRPNKGPQTQKGWL